MIVRLIHLGGFITNSSSTHAITINPGTDHDSQVYLGFENSFGWDDFIAASSKAKDEYLSHTVYESLGKTPLTSLILKGLSLPYVDDFDGRNCYIGVDHQSAIAIPKDIKTGEPSIEFIKDLRAALQKEGVVIWGGNDNGEYSSNKEGEGVKWYDRCLTDCNNGQIYARKDGQWWVMLNAYTGDFAVFTFDDSLEQKYEEGEGHRFDRIAKTLSRPITADVKITNICGKACGYCYQNSQPNGVEKVDFYMNILEKLMPLTVAFGGGEPTESPNFYLMLNYLPKPMIKTFTTRSIAWLDDYTKYKAIDDNCKAFAFSLDAGNIDEFDKICQTLHERKSKLSLTAQIIPEIMKEGEFEHVIKHVAAKELECKDIVIRITMLGFKHIGRGKSFKLNPAFDVIATLNKIANSDKNIRLPRIGFDTALANTYRDHLVNVKNAFIHYTEGEYNCYIDMVEGKIGSGSYHPETMKEYPEYATESEALKLFSEVRVV